MAHPPFAIKPGEQRARRAEQREQGLIATADQAPVGRDENTTPTVQLADQVCLEAAEHRCCAMGVGMPEQVVQDRPQVPGERRDLENLRYSTRIQVVNIPTYGTAAPISDEMTDRHATECHCV